MKFGENLKLIRKSKKISQEDLAYKLGVSRQSVSKWETGENYPSMTNILCLCDIFKCKINELVHEDFTDINSLDEEIKMSVVKFKKDEQKKMKGLSKIIYMIARVFKIASIIGIVISVLLLISSFIIIPNTKFDDELNKVTIFNNEFNYEIKDNLLIINDSFKISSSSISEVNKFITNNNTYKISFIVVLSISLIISCYLLFKLLSYLEKLFINIYNNDTPFNSDNTNYIKMIAIYSALYTFIPDISGLLASIIFKLNLNITIDLINYLFVVIIIVISYIFKYGYEIQLDSKGKIYGEVDE